MRYMPSLEDLGEPYDRLTEFLTLEDILKFARLLQGRQIYFPEKVERSEAYLCLQETFGEDKAKDIYQAFVGETTYFPTFKASCRPKVKKLILKRFTGYNHRELAKQYGYSERSIYRIVEASKHK